MSIIQILFEVSKLIRIETGDHFFVRFEHCFMAYVSCLTSHASPWLKLALCTRRNQHTWYCTYHYSGLTVLDEIERFTYCQVSFRNGSNAWLNLFLKDEDLYALSHHWHGEVWDRLYGEIAASFWLGCWSWNLGNGCDFQLALRCSRAIFPTFRGKSKNVAYYPSPSAMCRFFSNGVIGQLAFYFAIYTCGFDGAPPCTLPQALALVESSLPKSHEYDSTNRKYWPASNPSIFWTKN